MEKRMKCTRWLLAATALLGMTACSDYDNGYDEKKISFEQEFFSAFDDITSASLFASVFKGYVKFNTTAKTWYVYDGIRWKPDEGNVIVDKYGMLLARSLWVYSGSNQRQDFGEYVLDLQNHSTRKVMLEDAKSLLPVRMTDFDVDPYLFNCKNVVLNLKDHTYTDHDPDLLLSKVANVDFDPEADDKAFSDFMDAIMQGDQGKIGYLQKLFGYSLTGTNEREECYMLFGSTTRNGKSTLLNTIRFMMGDYGANIQPETLAMQKTRDGRSASGDIARLNGVRFLQMSEPPKRMKLDVALLKTLIGRDPITARHLYEREFEFIPCFKLFINTNFLPTVLDDTLFSSGRVKVVTFNKHFSEAEQDKGLKDRLLLPENLSALLNWCLAGLKQYHADGNTIFTPEAVESATADYREKSDKLKNFFNECMTENPFDAVKAKDAYTSYSKWCQANGYCAESKGNFFDELRGRQLLSKSATINGKTVENVIKGYTLDDDIVPIQDFTS